MKFVVTIEETLEKAIEIDAENPFEAISKVQRMYADEEIVLSADDFVSTEFYADEYVDIDEKESN